MSSQITNTFFMVRPVSFGKNEETSANNHFQQDFPGMTAEIIQERALQEFDTFVDQLRSRGMEVMVFEDKNDKETPDSIFPNNWFSFHEEGKILTYPMFAKNRRKERKGSIIDRISREFIVRKVQNFTAWEEKNLFLEGTGSMILDRQYKIAYAAISERTSPIVLKDFCEQTGYQPIMFTAFQTVSGNRMPVYHTNVMMTMGEDYVVICLDCIDDVKEQNHVKNTLLRYKRKLIEITEEQVRHFAGNMLQVKNEEGEKFTVMSEDAYNHLRKEQLDQLLSYGEIIHSPIPTIERLGGGSVRCMMAEIFLSQNP